MCRAVFLMENLLFFRQEDFWTCSNCGWNAVQWVIAFCFSMSRGERQFSLLQKSENLYKSWSEENGSEGFQNFLDHCVSQIWAQSTFSFWITRVQKESFSNCGSFIKYIWKKPGSFFNSFREFNCMANEAMTQRFMVYAAWCFTAIIDFFLHIMFFLYSDLFITCYF